MDLYQRIVTSPLGKPVAQQLGLPQPPVLKRFTAGRPPLPGPVRVTGAPGGQVGDAVLKLLDGTGVDVVEDRGEARWGGVVYDATGIDTVAGLAALYETFHTEVRAMAGSGRAVVLGLPLAATRSPGQAAAQHGLEGFVRSLAKELRGGATAQLVLVDPGAEEALGSTLAFLLSGKSAYVDGQVIHVSAPVEGVVGSPADAALPLAGKVAVVTGAARGIGESIARVLARDGAHVVAVDVPGAAEPLAAVARRTNGSFLTLDVTDPAAPQQLSSQLLELHGGLDILVNNAGITRDKSLAAMSADKWSSVLEVNLASQERIIAALLDGGVLRRGGRVIGLSSMNGIAGQAGQTNYATSKAGVIGLTQGWAATFRERGLTINAVAPGFIETKMTAAVPLFVREAGRRLNSLRQGGLPVDVAETIAWLAAPGSGGLNGLAVRVCGQSLIGA
jgi:3-oxoacyl-[acyl-carrier protein] reductase